MQIGRKKSTNKTRLAIAEYSTTKERLLDLESNINKRLKTCNKNESEEIIELLSLTNSLLQRERDIVKDNLHLKKPLSTSFINSLLLHPSYKLLVKFAIVVFDSLSEFHNKELIPVLNTSNVNSMSELLQINFQDLYSKLNFKNSFNIGTADKELLEVDSLEITKAQAQDLYLQITQLVIFLLIKFPNHLTYISSDSTIKKPLANILDSFYFKCIYPIELKEISRLLDASFEVKETEKGFILKQFVEKDSLAIEITKNELYPLNKGKVHYRYSNSTVKNSVKEKIKGWTQLVEIKRHNGLRNTTQLVFIVESIIKDLKRIFGSLNECTICYSIMNKNELPNISCVSCANLFHKTCIETWLDNHAQDRKCPYCREEFY